MKKFSMLVLTWVMLGSLNHAVARSGHSGRGRQPGDLSQLMAKYGRVSIPAPKSAQDSLSGDFINIGMVHVNTILFI